MKTFNRTSLPTAIQYNGNEYKLDIDASHEHKKHHGLPFKRGQYVEVQVLHRRLRGADDLHGRPYQPRKWIFKKIVAACIIAALFLASCSGGRYCKQGNPNYRPYNQKQFKLR